jgi:hypothetical protein|tara:strand:- start:201 stop:755 length:555 start_codon:yes stop_codon:yes gene_type:complete
MKSLLNDLVVITKTQLDVFIPQEKIINSNIVLYPFFNLRQGKKMVDYQKSELFLICTFSIYLALANKQLIDDIDGDDFFNVFCEHLSEYITKDDTEYDLILHFEDRMNLFFNEVKDVIDNGMDSDPVNCVYCAYKAPLIGQFLLSHKSNEFKSNNFNNYIELKKFFVSKILNFQIEINEYLSKN